MALAVGLRILLGSAAMTMFTASAANIRHMLVVVADRFAALATNFRHVPPILTDGFTALATDFCHVFPVLADGCTALTADFRHVRSILTDRFTAFMACLARFFGTKLVCGAFFMSSMTALAGYLPLLVLIHRGKATLAGSMSAAFIIPVTAMRTTVPVGATFMRSAPLPFV
jgi:hypothetical protein